LSNGYNASVKRRLGKELYRYGVCALIVAANVLLFGRYFHLNPTTVALSFLLGVLLVSAFWGLWYAVFLAVVSTAAFNFFFLPPVGTFTIADPQNWVALFAFLVTAIVASDLSNRARKEAENATQRRVDVERLYSFSQTLLESENVVQLLNALPRYVVETFGVREVAILLNNRKDIYRSSSEPGRLSADYLEMAAGRGEPFSDPAQQIRVMPLRLGIRIVGAMGVIGDISHESLEALGSMVSVAIERAGAIESLTRAEAARESEQLRSALLDAVTHEFRTPLTSIKASVTAMLESTTLQGPERQELLTVINEETDRLNRLVGEAAEMARLDAGQVELHIAYYSVKDVIDAAKQQAKQALAHREVKIDMPEGLSEIKVDVERIGEAVAQLLENAAKYSPADSPIFITASESRDGVAISVADRGAGIDAFELGLIFERFYRGRQQRQRVQGTGMGLAIAKAIVEAHGGTIAVTSQLEHGSVFTITLPAAQK
jgi:two-component system, OmpR family, sensor histidine kinase KdpD